MTVSSNTRKAGPLSCNGSVVAFDFDFTCSDDDDIQVILATSAGVETVLTKTTHYTVALNADQTNDPGGTVTTVSTYASGYTITVIGALAYNQQTALTNLGGFFPTVINSALDKATILIQQIKEILDRTLRLPASSSASTELPTPSAGKAIGWNATADGLTNITSLTGVAVSTYMETVLDDTTAAAARSTLGLGALSTLATVGTSQIDNDAVTYAKMQEVTAYCLVGNNTGSTANPVAVAFSDQSTMFFSGGYIRPVTYGKRSQTVLSGPVDSSGYASFGGSTGSTTVTMSGTLVASAAAGYLGTGPLELVGTGTNLSWTGLSTNGTMYLYVTVVPSPTGPSLTTGSSTSAPVYQWGGNYSTSSGVFTHNIQEGLSKVGNGTIAEAAYRVYVGEVTVAGNVVTAITWYALNGQYDSGWFSIAAASAYAKSHNLGIIPLQARALGKTAGSVIGNLIGWDNDGATTRGAEISTLTTLSASLYTTAQAPTVMTAASTTTTAADGRLIIERGW